MPDASTPDTQTPAMATDSQIQALEKLGIDYTPPITKREASQRIEEAVLKLDKLRHEAEYARAQAEVDMKRAAYESVKLDREIDASGLGDEVEDELARMRDNGRNQSAKRQSKRSR